MSTQTIPDAASIDLTTGDSSSKTRRWWNPFQRSDRPQAGNKPRRRLFNRNRDQFIEEFQAEHRKLVETLERLNDRVGAAESAPAASSAPSMELDPMPVIRGIEGINKGQKEISASLESLSGFVQRAEQTDERLVATVSQVDKTLSSVQGTQAKTVDALGQVGDRMDTVTERFEKLFSRMSEAEQAMADDYRKLQQRTLYAVAGISATVLVALGVFMAGPLA